MPCFTPKAERVSRDKEMVPMGQKNGGGRKAPSGIPLTGARSFGSRTLGVAQRAAKRAVARRRGGAPSVRNV